MDDLTFDGQMITWGNRKFIASTGLPWKNYYIERSSEYQVNGRVHSASDPFCRPVGAYCVLQYNRSTGRFRPIKTRQHPDFQDQPDGPVPEGRWQLARWLGDTAEDNGRGTCALKPSWKLEKIPRDDATTQSGKSCNPYRESWGDNRIRIEPADSLTRNRLARNGRGGFYIHDSTKGFSHGCIEVDPSFFVALYKYYQSGKAEKALTMTVRYVQNRRTYGGTKQ